MSPQPLGWSEHRNTARSEDLAWMAATGETHTGAAKRLGVTLDALEKWCARHDRAAWRRLIANANQSHVA